jgi:hypothetical protein
MQLGLHLHIVHVRSFPRHAEQYYVGGYSIFEFLCCGMQSCTTEHPVAEEMLHTVGVRPDLHLPCRFYLIANGILYRHWYHPGVNKPWLALGIMVYFTAVSLGAFLLRLLPVIDSTRPACLMGSGCAPDWRQISAMSSPIPNV